MALFDLVLNPVDVHGINPSNVRDPPDLNQLNYFHVCLLSL